jgi:hypothetical protein
MARFERSTRPAAGGPPTPDGRPTVKMRLDPSGRWQPVEEPPPPRASAAAGPASRATSAPSAASAARDAAGRPARLRLPSMPSR